MSEQDEQHPFVGMVTDLAQDEADWRTARLRTILRAQRLLDAEGVTVAVVAKVLGISVRSWYRRAAELHGVTGDEAGELAALAAGDQLDAEARDQR